MVANRQRARRRRLAAVWLVVAVACGGAVAAGWLYLGEPDPVLIAATTLAAVAFGGLATWRIRARERERRRITPRELWKR